MDTELREFEIVGFVECSYSEVVRLFGAPLPVRDRSGWIHQWNGRHFLITDGEPRAENCSGDYSFMVSATDKDAGIGFALYFGDVVYCDRLTRGMRSV